MKFLTPPPSDLVDIKFSEHWFDSDLVGKYNDMLNHINDLHIKDIMSLINSSIKSVNILGFNAEIETQEQGRGANHLTSLQLGTKSWQQALNSNTIELEIFHTEGYLTWLFFWESIQSQFTKAHKKTIKDKLVIDILNVRREKIFEFTFNDFLFNSLDDLSLNAETQNTDFGNFSLGITFKQASASVKAAKEFYG
jgi:hypothetical protein